MSKNLLSRIFSNKLTKTAIAVGAGLVVLLTANYISKSLGRPLGEQASNYLSGGLAVLTTVGSAIAMNHKHSYRI